MLLMEFKLKVKHNLKHVMSMMKKLKVRRKDICHLNFMLNSVKVVKL